MIKVGDKIPEFELPDMDGRIFSSAELKGRFAVIFFFPKAFTPGCTSEVCSFRDNLHIFQKYDVVLIGISGDNPQTQKKFAQTYNLPYKLLCDTDGKVRKLFGVGKTLGIIPQRVTFVIDKQGTIIDIVNSQFLIKKHIERAIETIRKYHVNSI